MVDEVAQLRLQLALLGKDRVDVDRRRGPALEQGAEPADRSSAATMKTGW
ncbi:MAG: hypothetical protein R3D25_04460 [Geminicoccaceae bacterium]